MGAKRFNASWSTPSSCAVSFRLCSATLALFHGAPGLVHGLTILDLSGSGFLGGALGRGEGVLVQRGLGVVITHRLWGDGPVLLYVFAWAIVREERSLNEAYHHVSG